MYPESIETQDLILKKAEMSDLDAIYKNFWSQQESARYMLWEPMNKEEAEVRLKRVIEFQKDRMAYFVYEKHCGEAIGTAGMKMIAEGVYQDSGIGIGPDFVRKGYGRQILTALSDYCFQKLKAQKIICSCMSENEPSRRLQLACGFHYVKTETEVLKDRSISVDYFEKHI